MLLDKLDGVFLAIDEICDGGWVSILFFRLIVSDHLKRSRAQDDNSVMWWLEQKIIFSWLNLVSFKRKELL